MMSPLQILPHSQMQLQLFTLHSVFTVAISHVCITNVLTLAGALLAILILLLCAVIHFLSFLKTFGYLSSSLN